MFSRSIRPVLMLTFDRYLFNKILISTLVGVISMSFLGLSGQVLKEAPHLFSRDAQGLSLLFKFLLHTFPYILSYMLPWAFLTSVLLTINSLSQNNEIVSIRMSGMNYFRISLPIIILGLLGSSLLYYTSGSLTPNSRLKINEMLGANTTTSEGLQLTPRLLNDMLGARDFLVHADSMDNKQMTNLHLYQMDQATGAPKTYIFAKQAFLDFSNAYKVSITLKDVYMEDYNGEDHPETLFSDEVSPLILPINKRKPSSKVKYKTNAEIVEALNGEIENNAKEDRLDYFSEIASRVSMSLSCLSFSILGLPLGLQKNRKATNNGFVWGIITAGLFFGLLLGLEGVGETTLVRGVALFIPNAVAFIAAIYLFRRIRFNS